MVRKRKLGGGEEVVRRRKRGGGGEEEVVRDSEVLLLLEHSVAEDQPAVWSFLAPQRMMQYRPLLSLEHHLSNNVVLCCPLPARAYSALMEAEKQLALCFQHPAGPSTCFGDQIKEDGANTC